jgi:hypothetical protein
MSLVLALDVERALELLDEAYRHAANHNFPQGSAPYHDAIWILKRVRDDLRTATTAPA